MAVRYRKIRRLVEEILTEHGVMEAPVPVESIVGTFGAIIHEAPAPDDLSGYIARNTGSGATVIGVNESHAPNRRRFTVAHELGHLLLHRGYTIHVDRADGSRTAFQINLRGEVATEGTDEEEREANNFAGELLMPALFLAQDLAEIRMSDLLDDKSDDLSRLARKYKVSTRALTYRLANLRYIRLE